MKNRFRSGTVLLSALCAAFVLTACGGSREGVTIVQSGSKTTIYTDSADVAKVGKDGVLLTDGTWVSNVSDGKAGVVEIVHGAREVGEEEALSDVSEAAGASEDMIAAREAGAAAVSMAAGSDAEVEKMIAAVSAAGKKKGQASGTDAQITVAPAEAASVTYVKYADPSGYFSMDIPRGWAVETGLKPSGAVDLISYAITVYDPKSPDRMLYFNLNCSGFLKSEEARSWHRKNYGRDSYFASAPVVSDISTKGFFRGMNESYGYRGFTVLEDLGQSVLGGDILEAECTSRATGNKMKGLFTATVTSYEYPVQKNPFNYAEGMVDLGVVTAYDIIMETAPSEEFIDWQPVLDHCLGTISFTSAFNNRRNEAWRQVIGTSTYLMSNADAISGMIMDTWENSSRSSDILSQKRSDATLGYERVYDTETGEYLKAENGFTDWYDGRRYVAADSDTAYLSPVSGTIYWK
ncbi:MAG: hypothetical protein J5969_06895 [Lachnospiraceae bacterium]|nr:hypothetical protein [Lachnospiraceae bacterium]